MTGRELVLEALASRATERVPWVPFCGVHSAALIGVDAATFLRSADLIVAGQRKAIELYRADGIPVVFDLQIEAEVLGCALTWATENPPAVTTHPLETGERTLATLRIPQPGDGRIPIALEAARRLRREFPDVALYGLITGPFTLALHLLGARIFTDMFDEPAGVRNLLDFCSRVSQAMAGYYAAAGCDVIAMVDPMTSQVGPEQFREFCLVPARAVFDHIHSAGCKGSFFVCGHAQQNIEIMCESHCDNISIDENIPLDYVRDIARARGISFGGNLQLTVVMLMGSENDNRRNALQCMDIGGTSSFVLAPGCDIPFATPPANIQAIAELVHDPYKREIARQMVTQETPRGELPLDMSEYGAGDRVIVDVITLDSEACAPCQYMVESVKQIAPQFEGIVIWREHKIKHAQGVALMTSLMVHNIPTICIDGQITFVSRIPPREALVEAIQKRVNEKLRGRLKRHRRVIRVFGPPTPDCLQIRANVKRALQELGADVDVQEIEDEARCAEYGILITPAVSIARQWVKAVGEVPSVVVIKEWLKQLQD